MKNLPFSIAYSDEEGDYMTNYHYLTYTFLFRKVGRMYFLNLERKGESLQQYSK